MSSSESRREKSEERREKREERRQITDPKRPPEVPTGGRQRGTYPFYTIPPGVGASGGLISGPRAEGREQRKERREKRETSTTKISRSKDAMVRSQNGGMVQKRVGP